MREDERGTNNRQSNGRLVIADEFNEHFIHINGDIDLTVYRIADIILQQSDNKMVNSIERVNNEYIIRVFKSATDYDAKRISNTLKYQGITNVRFTY